MHPLLRFALAGTLTKNGDCMPLARFVNYITCVTDGEVEERTFQFAPREMVIRLNDLDIAERFFIIDGMVISAVGSDTWPIRDLLRQLFEQTLLKWLRIKRSSCSDADCLENKGALMLNKTFSSQRPVTLFVTTSFFPGITIVC